MTRRNPILVERPPPPRSASDTQLARPPYGVVVVGMKDDDDRSCVVCKPVRPVPKKPKMKAMDHWDLIVAFDGKKHQEEVAQYLTVGKHQAHARFRGTLDAQMDEVNAAREEARQNKIQEQKDLDARLEENKRVVAAEKAAEQAKVDLQNKMNTEMLGSINARKRRALEKRQRDQEQMSAWLANEKKRRDDEKRERDAEHARKCEQARKEMEEAIAEAARRKKQREEDERAYIAQQKKSMDDAVAVGRAAVQARMDQIERNCATIGAEIAGRDAREAAALEARIKRVLEEEDRRSKEDAAKRKSTHDRKVREMLNSLDEQCKQRELDAIEEKKAGDRQAKIWKEQYEEGVAKDKAEEEARRKARENLDDVLIKQMSHSISLHPRNFGITAHNQTRDVNYNKAIFEQMAEEGFRDDMTYPMMGKVKAKSGKLDPFPSVPAYEGEIHEMEAQIPDV